MVGTLVMAPKSVTFRRHDHLVSVLFGDLLSHSCNITFSMFLYLVSISREWENPFVESYFLSYLVRTKCSSVHFLEESV